MHGRNIVLAMALAGCLGVAPFTLSYGASSDDFSQRLETLVDKAERSDAADSAFLRDLRDLAKPGYSSSYDEKPDIDKLNELIDRAESSDAAQPAFIRDLRELADDYEGGSYSSDSGSSYGNGETVLEDSFDDGDYTRDPRWSVAAGEFRVADGALESKVRRPESGSAQDTGAAVAGVLLGAITGNQTAVGGQPYAAIHTATDVPNSFDIKVVISAQEDGRFDFGPYQGSGNSGYRVSVTSGPSPQVQLLRVSSKGSSVIDSWDGNIGDGKVDLRWTRDRNGEMTVSVDGDRVIEARDRSFKDPFDGFVMVNEGGDFAVDEVTVADNG